MSSISASGVGQGLMQFLQQISTDSQSAVTDAASPTAAATTTSTPGAQVAGHHHHHHHGGALQEIQDAVTNALKTAQANGSSTDPNKVIQTAIEQILGGANNVTPLTNSTTSATPGADSNSAQSVFAQTLQSFGVDPQQFRNDFLSAIKDAQNGQVNSGQTFGNFPTGMQIDTTG